MRFAGLFIKLLTARAGIVGKVPKKTNHKCLKWAVDSSKNAFLESPRCSFFFLVIFLSCFDTSDSLQRTKCSFMHVCVCVCASSALVLYAHACHLGVFM